MARTPKTIYTVTDDLTQEVIDEADAVELTFSYGGQAYTIDLHKDNAKKLDDFIAPYIDAARPAKRGPGAPKDSGPARPGSSAWKAEKYGKGGKLSDEQKAEWDALPPKVKAKYQK